MTRYIARRLLIAIPVLLSITLIVFVMLHSAGGDPAVVMLGPRASAESLAALRAELGLDQPLPQQYVEFVRNALQGDFGQSYRSKQPVAHEIFSRFPATVELAIGAMFIATIIGLFAGTIAATRKNSFFDYSSTAMSLIGVSVPTFWFGIILIIMFGVEL